FFLKSASPEQLAEAIRSVAAGESIVAPGLLRALIRRAVTTAEPKPISLPGLSPREHEVLRCMACGDANADIARKLYLAAPTVKSHVRHIMAKLGATSRVQAVLIARSAGVGEPGQPET
ncbi:MAG TPA: response regulator transcription factor, partial [Acidimicrobiales bacterium]|nr:response regulator transcription factor [Acidimicrobiales bacterium]